MYALTCFKSKDDAPECLRLPGLEEQKEYLINGRLEEWDGNIQDVYAPTMFQNEKTKENSEMITCTTRKRKSKFLKTDYIL